MRAFVALDLPEPMLAPIARLQAGLGVGRVVAEENLHLTLAFLGEVDPTPLADVAAALAEVRVPGFDLALNGLDVFGGRRPGVLFVNAIGGEGLTRLHDKVARAVRAGGIDLARARFRPHVTIARFAKAMTAKDRQRLGEFLALNGSFALEPARAMSFALYRSHLRHDGAVHEPLASYDLAR